MSKNNNYFLGKFLLLIFVIIFGKIFFGKIAKIVNYISHENKINRYINNHKWTTYVDTLNNFSVDIPCDTFIIKYDTSNLYEAIENSQYAYFMGQKFNLMPPSLFSSDQITNNEKFKNYNYYSTTYLNKCDSKASIEYQINVTDFSEFPLKYRNAIIEGIKNATSEDFITKIPYNVQSISYSFNEETNSFKMNMTMFPSMVPSYLYAVQINGYIVDNMKVYSIGTSYYKEGIVTNEYADFAPGFSEHFLNSFKIIK